MQRRLVLATIAVVAVSACGGGASTKAQVAAVGAVPAATERSGTSHMALTVHETATKPSVTELTVRADGLFDYTNRRGALTFTYPPGALSERLPLETIQDGDVTYVRRAPAPLAPPSKPWLRLDAATAHTGSDALVQSSADPTRSLALLRGASSNVRRVGTDRTRGAATTKYRMTLDLAKVIHRAPSASPDPTTSLLDLLGTSSVPAELWVDNQGRLRKFSYTVDLAKLHIADAVAIVGAATTTLELYGFGEPVRIDIPPASSVEPGAVVSSGPGATAARSVILGQNDVPPGWHPAVVGHSRTALDRVLSCVQQSSGDPADLAMGSEFLEDGNGTGAVFGFAVAAPTQARAAAAYGALASSALARCATDGMNADLNAINPGAGRARAVPHDVAGVGETHWSYRVEIATGDHNVDQRFDITVARKGRTVVGICLAGANPDAAVERQLIERSLARVPV
jgi:hypothetical protein